MLQVGATGIEEEEEESSLDDQCLIPDSSKFLLFSTTSISALGPTQPPIQWIPRANRPGREADHSPQSSVEVKNGGMYFILPRVHGVVLNYFLFFTSYFLLT
jgi:hypothetical protein